MSYQTGQAFRRALEARLLNQSTQGSVSLVRLRKLVAFDRFLARLLVAQPDGWLLKGGLALQLRLGERARTTKDIDVLLRLPHPQIGPTLMRAAVLDLGDWFSFTVQQDPAQLPGLADGGWRFFVTARLDSRRFESFHVDIGVGDPVLEPAEALTTPPLLVFAGIAALTLPCYPLSQHLAEKVHAYVKPARQRREHAGQGSDRYPVDRRLWPGGRVAAARRHPGDLCYPGTGQATHQPTAAAGGLDDPIPQAGPRERAGGRDPGRSSRTGPGVHRSSTQWPSPGPLGTGKTGLVIAAMAIVR